MEAEFQRTKVELEMAELPERDSCGVSLKESWQGKEFWLATRHLKELIQPSCPT